MSKIDFSKLEKEILDEFFDGNVESDKFPELTEQIARIAARISVITAAKILYPVDQSVSEKQISQ